MENHPIPQQISAYSFKLVGDMTLKQFSQLAAGALISLLFYASPLNPAIKWPLIVVSFLFGVALAFLPIEDRPLSTWIVIFFRSIYSPTVFVWNKAKIAPAYFQPEKIAQSAASIQVKPQIMNEMVAPQTVEETKLEEKEQSFLSRVREHLIAPGSTVVIETTPMHTYQQSPAIQKPLEVPQQRMPVIGWEDKTDTPSVQPQQPLAYESKTEMFTPAKQEVTQQAKFSDEVMPPIPPSRPNVIVGQVLDQNGKIVEGAILEIRDSVGRPVRALRSNRLGHFIIVTPLLDGVYTIVTEKDGLTFDPVSFVAEDKIIPSIAIWAKDITDKTYGSTLIN